VTVFHKRILVSVACIVMLTACNTGQPSPKPYACGNVALGHCYSKTIVGDHITGFLSRIVVSSKLLPGDGFITNEFWLRNYTGTSSWIEVGYIQNTVERLHYFWAQNNENGVFTKQSAGDVPVEELDTPVTFIVRQVQSDRFEVRIDGVKTHFKTETALHLWAGTSGGYVELGQELAGTTGAAAGIVTFDRNRVRDSQGWKWLVNESAGATADEPPYGGWLAIPKNDAMEGGVFSTHCCTAAR
jgi:hypothetical protein